MKTRYSGSDAPRGHRGCCPFARIGATRNLQGSHHRESSGAVWRAWLMDRRQDCPDKSSKHLRRSSAVLFPAQIVGFQSIWRWRFSF